MKTGKVTSFYFPNTAERGPYISGYYLKDKALDMSSKTFEVDDIQFTTYNGEMASIAWLQAIKGGKVVAEIKASVCNIFYDYSLEEETEIENKTQRAKDELPF